MIQAYLSLLHFKYILPAMHFLSHLVFFVLSFTTAPEAVGEHSILKDNTTPVVFFTGTHPGATKEYSVSKVVDGDTFWINDGSTKGKKIRLIGVDAPETRNTGKKKAGYFGPESKKYLGTMLAGKKVRLEFDVDPIDRYGRTLAYVYLKDGTFVNAELIRRGFAMVLTVAPNVKHAAMFAKLQAEARKNRRGLWAK
jgi:micrococcal nuclease